MLKFNTENKVWTEVETKVLGMNNKKDALPSIDSHSLVTYTKEDKTVIYSLCGFIGADVGKDSSSVHSFDVSTGISTMVYDGLEGCHGVPAQLQYHIGRDDQNKVLVTMEEEKE